MIDTKNPMPEEVLAIYNQVKELAKYAKKYSETLVASLITLEKVYHLNRKHFSSYPSFESLLQSIEGAPSDRTFRNWKDKFYGAPLERPTSRKLYEEDDRDDPEHIKVLAIPDSAVSANENSDGSYDIKWRDAYTRQVFLIHIPADAVTMAKPLLEVVKSTAMTHCSGAGAMDLAIRDVGYHVVAAVDPDQNCVDTLRLNFPETKVFKKRIDEMTDEDLASFPRPQHVHMSPPCQKVSGANPYASWDHPLNAISFHCLEVVQRLKPETFTYEEVEGLTRSMMDPIFIPILSCARSLGYKIGAYVLHGTDAGSCQTRPRFIMIGYREDLGITPSMPQPVPDRHVKRIKDLIPDAVYVKTGDGAKQRVFGASGYLNTITRRGPTIVTATGERKDIADERKLFEFPDDFQFIGSDTDVRDRIGNCVIPKFGKWLMEHVKAEMEEHQAEVVS